MRDALFDADTGRDEVRTQTAVDLVDLTARHLKRTPRPAPLDSGQASTPIEPNTVVRHFEHDDG
jgi:hypothetical protein